MEVDKINCKMKKVGGIENYYGGIFVHENDGKYYWSIDTSGIEEEFDSEEIPESLYNELIKFKPNPTPPKKST